MTKYTTFLFLLMFVFFSVFMVSVPQIVSAHDNGNSHNHPHPPEQNCMTCGVSDIPGQHFCAPSEREKQELEVKIRNAAANNKRLEEKYNDDQDKSFGTLVKEIWVTTWSTSEQAVVKVMEWVTDKEGMVRCQGCNNWVYDELEHWGTGECAIGHVHWTCLESERILHAGCHWVDEPENDPDSMYDGAKYSWSCSHCSNTRWTNSYDEWMGWQGNPCSICGR